MKKSIDISKNWPFDKHPNGIPFSSFDKGQEIYIWHPDGTFPTKVMKIGKTSAVVLSSTKYSKGSIIMVSPRRSSFLMIG
jgi:hypothetical protein